MLSPQLRKIKIQLEEGATNIDIDKEELLAELNEMEAIQGVLLESLSLLFKSNPMFTEYWNPDAIEIILLSINWSPPNLDSYKTH